MLRHHTYFLFSNSSGRSIKADHAPKGWSENKVSFLRDELYYGVFKTILFDYSFTKEMYDFMLEEHRLFEYDLDMILRVYNRGNWQFDGKIDLNPFEIDFEVREFKVDIIRSAFIEDFQNRDEVDLNVFNEQAINGIEIDPAITKTVKMRPKILQYRSVFELTEINEILNQTKYLHTLPFASVQNNNPNVFAANGVYLTGSFSDFQVPGNAIYHNTSPVSQSPSFVFSLDVDTVFQGIDGNFEGVNPKSNNGYAFTLNRYDENGNPVENVYGIAYNGSYGNINDNSSFTVTVPSGHFLIFYVNRYKVQSGQVLTQGLIDAAYHTEFNYNICNLTIDEPSTFPETFCECIPPFELFKNLIGQMTGYENLVSNIFGRQELGYEEDGEAAYDMVTNGYLIRLFKTKLQDPENGRELATSFRDAFKSYNTRYNLGLKIIDKTVYIEKKEDMLDKTVVVNLGEVSAKKRMPNENVLFNQVKVGYENLLIEEINGADEFNTTSTYTNSLRSFKETFDLISPYNAAGYAIEKARRQNREVIGDEDTRYDEKIFRLQTTFVDGVLVNERDERFGLVGNIVSPETAMNLNLAPARMMDAWKPFLSIPVRDKIYKYQSKDKNSNLILDYNGTVEYVLNSPNVLTDADDGTFEDQESLWAGFQENSTSSNSGRSSNQARTGTYSMGFIPENISGTDTTFGVSLQQGIFPLGIYGITMASWTIPVQADRRYILKAWINVIQQAANSQDDVFFTIKPRGVSTGAPIWARDHLTGWQPLEWLFVSPFTGTITVDLFASWGGDKTPNRVFDIECYLDDLICEEYTKNFISTGEGFSQEGENIDIGKTRYHLPYIEKFIFPVTRETLDALEKNPLGLMQYTYKGFEFFDFLHEIEAQSEKRGGKWKILPTAEIPVTNKEVDPALLPILKYSSGDDDYLKYSDGDDDYLLYDEK